MHYLIALLLVVVPSLALGAASQLTNTFKAQRVEGQQAQAILIHCDNSGSADDTLENGEACEAGDWSKPLDARGFSSIHIHFEEFGTSSGAAKVWNCSYPLDDQWDDSTDPPGTAMTQGKNVACQELTSGITLDGTTTKDVSIDNTTLGLQLIYGEIDACTLDCSSRLSVFVSP